jgi:glutathione S-transferase
MWEDPDMLKLNVLKPSVTNMCVRVLVRAAGLEVEEVDVYGHTRSPEYLAKCPAHATPMLESAELPRGALWESCAVMQYLCNRYGLAKFYPTDPARRAMVDSAMSYVMTSFYPLVARATYPVLGFPPSPGEVAASDASESAKKAAQDAAAEACAEPIEVVRSFYIGQGPYIGGESPSIADIRFAVTLEFLAAIDYALPAWAKTYMAAVEKALGQAYTKPAADVRGYIAHVRSN